jgi:uncharacterized RDD family membrane protein YckC
MRRLVADPLLVAPDRLGLPLASPARRFVAFALDLVLLLVPTIAISLAMTVGSVYVTDRPAFEAIGALLSRARSDPAVAHKAMRDLTPLILRMEPKGIPAAAVEAAESGDMDKAADILSACNYSLTFRSWLDIEGERAPNPKTVLIELDRVVPPLARGLAVFGVPALYFTLFTCGRRGATIGKRVLGIRVVRLDEEHLSYLEGLERFVGYVHLPATMFVSLADLWRDPNRRLPHDRVVHTAVVRTATATVVRPAVDTPHAPARSVGPPAESPRS